MEPFLLGVVIVLAGGFAFLNGFHDVSNSVATAVRTRALTPTIAVLLAAVFNLVGALLSTSLALFFTDAGIGLPAGSTGLGILLAALLAACLWGLLTWWRGKPSSSTHALLGGIIGAGGASQLTSGPAMSGAGQTLLLQIVLPLLLSPVLAYALAYAAVFPATWLLRHGSPSAVNRGNRMAQSVLAGAFALGHGLQDGQRTMAVILLALVGAGYASGSDMPVWVQVSAAVLLAGGSLLGGWRITHTLGNRLVHIDPLRGMTAQGVSSAMLFIGAISLHMPLSSTHTMTSAIVGAGANQRFASVQRPHVVRILLIWLGTAPATAVVGGVFFLALTPLL
ncbi:inorganic phosphate transporter [Arthrobacter agilis]|uniref:inorganic phosphate transporter n=1 Tax=Arthrobacter agilis TaxID=37921 RepID=UPI000B35EFDD|nr:inorganic phosphate transporter [Arthrobacter agilis]OUM42406.1 phosphate transporter [Arthrobacter agilis]PPB45747.1 inorganic phosphate transporter [Arthrobacter agilis]TPV26271.1 inorganic phosphate transporter [Arthrobacter agilis]VDR30878.1 Low-affinity inorganic phosphate transporter 1 [Arthrobacter agilis]